jgi:hypothetical protein
MVATAGPSRDLPDVTANVIRRWRDALAARETTIDRLSDPGPKAPVQDLRGDHLRRLHGFEDRTGRHDAAAPPDGDLKQPPTTGKAALADRVGEDATILRAMCTDETGTVTACANGAPNGTVPPAARPSFAGVRADVARHRAWMERRSTRGAA